MIQKLLTLFCIPAEKSNGTVVIKNVSCLLLVTLHLAGAFQTYAANSFDLENSLYSKPPVTCAAPTGLVPSLVASDNAVLEWDAFSPEPTDGYQYYITQSAVLPTAATVPTGNVFAGNSQMLTSLIGSTTYHAYVRASCGAGDFSEWAGTTFTTNCTAINITYVQNFNAVTVPAIPNCNTIENAGSGNNWASEEAASAYPGAGFTTKHLVYEGNSNTANAWYYTQGVRLVEGTSYRISYVYGGDSYGQYLTNKLEVRYGAAPDATAMNEFDVLGNHPAIKSRPVQNVTNFVAPRSGVFYFGFHATSSANSGKLYLDDISVSATTCLPATQLLSGQITATSALISWQGASAGYDYYYSTLATNPDAATLVSGSVSENIKTITGLASNTLYHYWIRSNCGNGDMSAWSVGGTFTTLTGGNTSYCIPMTSFQNGAGIINVTMGTINKSSGKDVVSGYENYSNLSTTVARSASVPVAVTFQVSHTYDVKIWVDWNNNGNFNQVGEEVFSGTVTAENPSVLAATFAVPAAAILGTHRLRIGAKDVSETSALVPCRTSDFQVFEDYSIFVVETLTPLALSANSITVCQGVNSALVTVTGAANFTNFSWSPPTGVTGSLAGGFRFNTESNTTYTLTAFNRTSLVSNAVNINVVVNQKPTALAVSPVVPSTVCQGQIPQQLVATGGTVHGTTIIAETFNGGISTGWNQALGFPAPAPVDPRWILPNDGVVKWGSVMHSNDNSGFAMVDSDFMGTGTVTRGILRSPTFSLVGYSNALLTFYHYVRIAGGGDVAEVQLTTDDGLTVTPLKTFTTTDGSAAGFKKITIDLSAYSGVSNIRIYFRYDATWDWGWAIDNVKISASATSPVIWTPAAGLYLDSTATTPYAAGTGAAVVYALPTAARTYTATVSTGASCNVVATASVNVTPIFGGTLASASQQVCSNTTASAITASGIIGTILYWERADDAAFTQNVTQIPGSAGLSTLTPALIGTSAISQFFRTVVSVGGCNNAHSAVHSINVTSSTYNGTSWSNGIPTSATKAVFTGNYTATANLSVCSVEVVSGTVTINPNITLTVANGITVGGGSLVFENNASLIQTSTSKTINTGNIIYKRNTSSMVAYDYTFWSSPVVYQTLLGLSPDTRVDKFYWWNPVAYNWATITAPATTPMDAGKGYLIRAPYTFGASLQQFPGSFTGVPNNGEVLAPVTVSGPGNSNNFNFIGNPYPSAIDAELLMVQNPGTLNGGTTFYFWTHNHAILNHQYSTADYASFNLSGAVGTGVGLDSDGTGTANNTKPTKWIPAGQGFMAICHQSGNVVFNNSIRQGGNNANFYKSGEAAADLQKNRLWLELTNVENVYKQILVGYIENATNAFDSGYDGEAIDAGNAVNFYSILDDKKLSIQGRGLDFDNEEQIPLGFHVTNAGLYTIRLSEKDGFFTTQSAYLEDKFTGTIHNLSAGDYSFVAEAGTFDNRFVLRYNTNVLATQHQVFTENDAIVYKKQLGIAIETAGFDMTSVQIFDVNGRELYAKKNVNSKSFIAELMSAQQMLIVQITATTGAVIYKKIVF